MTRTMLLVAGVIATAAAAVAALVLGFNLGRAWCDVALEQLEEPQRDPWPDMLMAP